jgi:hypothetical protein
MYIQMVVKLSLCLINLASRHEDVWGNGDIALPFLNSALGRHECSASLTGRFTRAERGPATLCTGSWVGPRAGLDAVE